MKLYGAGNVILHYREKYRISQSQVCAGICSEMTLSRIETGEREFDSLLSESLLERLGKFAGRLEFVLNEEDYRLCELREKIENGMKERRIEDVRRCLFEYEKMCPREQKLSQQFLLCCRALLLEMESGSESEVAALLHRAIDLTRPDYKCGGRMLFTRMEIKIIYRLFLYENYEEKLVQPLLRFMDEMYDAEMKGEMMIPFLYRIMQRYEAEGNYHGMERIAERAIGLILEGRGYDCLADFSFGRIRAREMIYRERADWEIYRKALAEECTHLYYMYMIEDEAQKMADIEEYCEERLGWQITGQEI